MKSEQTDIRGKIMKYLNLKHFILFATLLIFPAVFANAQDLQERPPVDRPNARPLRLLEQLGLSRDQIQQIRRINQEKQPLMRQAQNKLRDANRDLDSAIYADNINEEEIKNRLKDVQAAQADVIKIRSMIEFEVRKVLTAEQLAKFRKLREEFTRQMEERRMENEENPNQRRNNPNLRQRRDQRPNF